MNIYVSIIFLNIISCTNFFFQLIIFPIEKIFFFQTFLFFLSVSPCAIFFAPPHHFSNSRPLVYYNAISDFILVPASAYQRCSGREVLNIVTYNRHLARTCTCPLTRSVLKETFDCIYIVYL